MPAPLPPVDVKRRLFSKVDRAPWHDRLAPVDGTRAALPDDQQQIEDVAAEVLPLSARGGGPERHGGAVEPAASGRCSVSPLGISGGRCRIWRSPIGRTSCAPPSTRRTLSGEASPKGGRWTSPTGQVHMLDLLVVPLPDGSGGHLGASIAFTDVTQQHRLQEEVQRTTQELETAYEELAVHQ